MLLTWLKIEYKLLPYFINNLLTTCKVNKFLVTIMLKSL